MAKAWKYTCSKPGAGPYRFPQEAVEWFLSDERNPMLVSFPRAGSHWLRFMCEAAFGRPILRCTMLHRDRDDFLLAYDHDDELNIVRSSVIYLYRRDVVGTVHSFVSTPKGKTRDEKQILSCTKDYARHLARWLLDEQFTTNKTVVTYEDMREDAVPTIDKIAKHLRIYVNDETVKRAVMLSTKERVHEVLKPWGIGVVPMLAEYKDSRTRFRAERAEQIEATFKLVEHSRLDKYVDFIA